MIVRFIFAFLLLYILYTVVSCAILPLFRKKVTSEYREKIERAREQFSVPHAERIRCIDSNAEALQYRFRAVEAAQKEIALSTFDFACDRSGNEMLAVLFHAAERGVKVRLLFDGLYHCMRMRRYPVFKALTVHPNVELKLYNPIHPLFPWKLNYRLHDKYLIVDDVLYILGGRNTTDLFLGEYRAHQNTDRDILVYTDRLTEKNSLYHLKQYFECVWNMKSNVNVICRKETERHRTAIGALRECYQTLKAQYPDAFGATDWTRETIEARNIALFFNPTNVGNKEPELWQSLCEMMRMGKRILVQTPYIILDRMMYRSLHELTEEGIEVRILTNSVKNGANPWGCTDYLNHKQQILKTGVSVYEYIGKTSLHAKAVMIDDRISVIGSFNMDMRSAYLDTEMMLVIDSAELNIHLKEKANAMTDNSRLLRPDGTVQNGICYEDRPWEMSKRILYAVLRVLLEPFRHIL